MKYLFLVLLTTFFFALTFASAPGEFSTFDLWSITCLIVISVGVQILIARMFARYRIVQNFVLAGFSAVNIFYANLALNDGFLSLSIYAQGLSLLLGLFIITTFINILDENPRSSWVLPAFFILAIAGVLVQTLYSTVPIPTTSTDRELLTAKNIQIVDFEARPNVYFISFDAIVPKVLLQKYLNIETTPYHEVLDTDYQRFANFFADRVPTRESLNSLLSLDIQHFSNATKNNLDRYFFTGLIPSPLLEIFKHNGYETTTLYRGSYFKKIKGSYVDNYIWDARVGACEFIDRWGYMRPILMGHCSLHAHVFMPIATRFGIGGPKSDNNDDIDFLISNMRTGIKNGKPQFFLAYIHSPGHTLKSFDYKNKKLLDEFRQTYLKKSEVTANQLTKIVTFIANEDPEAIVYLFGDHGPYLSEAATFEEDSAFYIQDRYGVYGGIYPRDRCAESFATPYNQDFMTILQGAHMIIRCLSGGKNAFLTLGDYRLPNFTTKDKVRYEDYLYE